MSDLISVAEAESLIAEHLSPFGVELVKLEHAAGRLLRESARAERDHPPFDRVMMDGVGIRWCDPLPSSFKLVGAQMAGMRTGKLSAEATCLEVTTGAVLPEGCDCVIPVEQIRREGDHYILAGGYRPGKGQFIHPRGSDCLAGAQVLDAGMRLGAPEMAQLAANGIAKVQVAAVPSIAIISTGDELVAVDAPLAEGQIRRSNDIAIAAALRAWGFDQIELRHIIDDLSATTDAIAELLAAHDVLILSGGVSMGQRDYVPQALDALGVRRVFHRIAQRPGKPMWFGIGPHKQAVFALPGNPVSSLACAIRYVRPGLMAAMGMAVKGPDYVCLDSEVETSPTLTCFVPVQIRQDGSGRSMAHPVLSRTSGDFSSLARTDGMVELPFGQDSVPAGTTAVLYRW